MRPTPRRFVQPHARARLQHRLRRRRDDDHARVQLGRDGSHHRDRLRWAGARQRDDDADGECGVWAVSATDCSMT